MRQFRLRCRNMTNTNEGGEQLCRSNYLKLKKGKVKQSVLDPGQNQKELR